MRFLAYSLAMLSGCTAPQTEFPMHDDVRIDHVIVGVADLDKAFTEMERMTGVRPKNGGSHPGRGTRNALMSLGDGIYLEILAPDPAQSADNADVRELRNLVRPTPIGWAVSADGESRIRSPLAKAGIPLSAPEPGSRAKPDGSVLHWVTFGYQGVDDPVAPFFIIWSDPLLHPSITSTRGCSMKSLSLTSATPALADAVKPLALNVSVNHGSAPKMELSLSCPKGQVRL